MSSRMSSRRVLAIGAAGVGLAALASVPSSASEAERDAAGALGGSQTRTFAFTSERVEESFLDLGEPGPTLGDHVVYTNRGHVEGLGPGEDYGTCTFHLTADGVDDFVFACLATLALPGGSITVQGEVRWQEEPPGPVAGYGVWAVTGGTGHYQGVSGQVLFRPVEPGEGEPARTEGELLLRW